MWGNFAGDGSKEGISTEKIFSSENLKPVCFFGVVRLITSISCDGYFSNSEEISLVEGRTISLVDTFEVSFLNLDRLSVISCSLEIFWKKITTNYFQ